MRIGFDATVLSPATRYTGMGRYAYHLLANIAMATAGDSLLIAYTGPDAGRPAGLPETIEWQQIPAGKLFALAGHLWLLPRLVHRDRLDVFHAPAVHTRPSLPPVPGRLPCPLVVTIHDLIPLTFYGSRPHGMPRRMRLFYRWNLDRAFRADRVITVSQASRREIIAAGVPGPKVHVVYNAADQLFANGDQNPPLGLPPRFFLYVGSLEPRKNLPALLAAFDLACSQGLEDDLVLVVERRSGHAAGIFNQMSAMGSRERVHLLHELDTGALAALYRRATGLVLPSLAEGFGLPAVEGMMSGTPVLSSGIPVLREVLASAAFYVDPRDPKDISAGLLRLSGDTPLRERLRREGRLRAQHFSWQKAALGTLDVYRQALGHHTPAAIAG